MPAFQTKGRFHRPFLSMALFSTGLVLFSVGACACFYIRQQREEQWAALKADAVSIARIVNEMVPLEPGITSLENFRDSGQSILASPFVATLVISSATPDIPDQIVNKKGYSQSSPGGQWKRLNDGADVVISRSSDPLTGGPMLLCSLSRQVSRGVTAGWINVGLSLKAYEESQNLLLRNACTIALTATVVGIAGSFFLTRRLPRPAVAMG